MRAGFDRATVSRLEWKLRYSRGRSWVGIRVAFLKATDERRDSSPGLFDFHALRASFFDFNALVEQHLLRTGARTVDASEQATVWSRASACGKQGAASAGAATAGRSRALASPSVYLRHAYKAFHAGEGERRMAALKDVVDFRALVYQQRRRVLKALLEAQEPAEGWRWVSKGRASGARARVRERARSARSEAGKAMSPRVEGLRRRIRTAASRAPFWLRRCLFGSCWPSKRWQTCATDSA